MVIAYNYIDNNHFIDFNPRIFKCSDTHFLRERAGVRTRDNLIKSQVLYQLSYTPSIFHFLYHALHDKLG